MHKEYLTTTQAAKLLKVSRFSVLNWVKQGKLRSITTHGGHQRISKQVIIDSLQKSGVSNPGDENANPEAVEVRCWQSPEVKASGRHHCVDCLVFKEQINRCFLSVKIFGNEKIHCNIDCFNCAYFAKYYPQQKKVIGSIRKTAVAKLVTTFPRADKSDVQGFLNKGFYVSGKYFAKARKKLSKLKIEKH